MSILKTPFQNRIARFYSPSRTNNVLNKSKRINIQKFIFFLISFLYVKNSNSYMIFSIINFSKRNFHKEFIKKNSLKKMNNIRKHSFCTLGPFLWQRAWIWSPNNPKIVLRSFELTIQKGRHVEQKLSHEICVYRRKTKTDP